MGAWGHSSQGFGWNNFGGWYLVKINLTIVLFLELGATGDWTVVVRINIFLNTAEQFQLLFTMFFLFIFLHITDLSLLLLYNFWAKLVIFRRK